MWPNEFPSFSPLEVSDADRYNALISSFPPYSNFAFSSMYVWYTFRQGLSVATLDNNLVIYYDMPYDERNSGYSVIGNNDIDNALTTVLDSEVRGVGVRKLVHVPEFVINQIVDKGQFKIREEDDYSEYILDSAATASLERPELGRIRRKVNRFLREVDGRKLEIKSLDLGQDSNRQLVLERVLQWESSHPNGNDPARTELDVLRKTLQYASTLCIQNCCVFIDERLEAICLYSQTADKSAYILHHLRVNYSFPYLFDYVTKLVSTLAKDNEVSYINMEMDLGIENLRRHKMLLRPAFMLKQFEVERQPR